MHVFHIMFLLSLWHRLVFCQLFRIAIFVFVPEHDIVEVGITLSDEGTELVEGDLIVIIHVCDLETVICNLGDLLVSEIPMQNELQFAE